MTTPKKKEDHEYGIGEASDGTVDIFPPGDLARRLAENRVLERAATEGEVDTSELELDISDLDDD